MRLTIGQVLRLARIHRVLARQGVYEVAEGTPLPRPVALLLKLPMFRARARTRAMPRARRIREALERLGPIFVKFGQNLSTRRDLLPRDVADELAKLQDKVPPFPSEAARAELERAYGRPLAEVFASFEDEPIAAASIAQVHGATLADGREVAVKVLRPDVEERIRRDVDLMYALARAAHRYWPELRRFRPVEVVAEYERVITDELDLLREAASASQLRRNFEGSPLLYIPEVHWDYCRPRVLVTERISGIPISDVEGLRSEGVDMAVLAARGVEIFFTQVFRHNFFHADMHPGNIFVDASEPGEPRYLAVDFGIVGSLDPRDQHYLAENFLAFFRRDYTRVARLHVNSGWVARGTRLDEVESAFRTVCEPIVNRPLKEISFGLFLVRLFTVARRFGMEVQPQLILLQKTLINIEGLGRELYPDLDLWETAQPILESWMSERSSGRVLVGRIRDELPQLALSLQELPQVAQGLLQQAAEGDLALRVEVPGLEAMREDARERAGKQHKAIAGGALVVAAAVWLGLAAQPAWAGWAAMAGGAWLLLRSRP